MLLRIGTKIGNFEIAIPGLNGPISVVPPNFVFFRQAWGESYKEAHGAPRVPRYAGPCEQMLASYKLRRAGSFGCNSVDVLGLDWLGATLAAQPSL